MLKLLLASLPDIRTGFLNIRAALQELLRPSVPGWDCQSAQPRGLTSSQFRSPGCTSPHWATLTILGAYPVWSLNYLLYKFCSSRES